MGRGPGLPFALHPWGEGYWVEATKVRGGAIRDGSRVGIREIRNGRPSWHRESASREPVQD
jgi:hypothetical protein